MVVWREIPINLEYLGMLVRKIMPKLEQLFVSPLTTMVAARLELALPSTTTFCWHGYGEC